MTQPKGGPHSSAATAAESRALRDAYEACQRLATSHYENFPVASRLLPAALRPHVAAIYAFARIADDFADEPGREIDERLRLLDDWRDRLHFSGAGNRDGRTEVRPYVPTADRDSRASGPESPIPDPRSPIPDPRSPIPDPRSPIPDPDMVFSALHDTIARFDLPVLLFEDLLSAFRQDVTTTRYETWGEVMDYCRRSADPVGKLVLRLSGYRRDDLDRASDAVCTALQLTNFWQDLAVDWSRGRLYVPADVWRRHAADPAALGGGRLTPEWAAALRECADRTRTLFEAGRTVCDGVSGRLRYELRATWLGGTRILDRLEHAGFDVFTSRPSLGKSDALVIAWGTLRWRRTAAPAHSRTHVPRDRG